MTALRRRFLVLAPSALLLALALTCSTAQASTPIYSFEIKPSSTQAGGHPDVYTAFEIGNNDNQPPVPCDCNNPKQIGVNPPPGLVGSPGNIPQCTAAEFAATQCPVDTQVGLQIFGKFAFTPVYNLVPRPGELALLGTTTPTPFPLPIIYTSITVRTESDYGLEFGTFNLPDATPTNIALLLWGVPASPIHDLLRFPLHALKADACPGGDPTARLLADEYPVAECHGSFLDEAEGGSTLIPLAPIPANSPTAPFTSNPTACGGTLQATIETIAFDLKTEHGASVFQAITGCDQLAFNPTLSAKPTTTGADSPSGVDVDLTVPQTLSPTTPTPSAIRDVTVTLPPGFTVNSGAADGKTSCTDAEAHFGTREPARCPEFSKIGTVEVISTSFPSALPGAMYLGQPLPGNRYRFFLVADGFSIHVKLAGTATPDPVTGQLTLSFHDLPQFSFQEFSMHIFGSERGLLATPTRCGTYPVLTTFTPWAYPDLPEQTSTQLFIIDSGPNGSPCPPSKRPFQPGFQAGVVDNTAGRHSPFSLRLTRDDGDQNLTGLEVSAPPGFSASLRGVAYCPEPAIARLADSSYPGLGEQASPSCPAASRIGTAAATAGPGSRPLSASGNVYLAGPYKGAPLSLVAVIPAVSGPYDLGNVAVRVALYVDPLTARVTAVSDSLPQIVDGIPLRTRSILVSFDRPGFTLNPTDCDPFSVDATASGDEGTTAGLSSHFQVANCADLAYQPRLQIKLTGGLNRLGHPAIHAVFRAKLGEANTRRISVTLPRGELLDNSHIGTVCTRVDFARKACPASSKLGSATVTTPLLDQPLEGTAYLRSSSHPLPDLAIDLRGQVDFELAARVDSVNARLRATIETAPDVPVSRVALDLAGGRRGILQNTKSLCGPPKRATVQMTGHNGVTLTSRPALQVACAKARHKRHVRRAREMG